MSTQLENPNELLVIRAKYLKRGQLGRVIDNNGKKVLSCQRQHRASLFCMIQIMKHHSTAGLTVPVETFLLRFYQKDQE